MCCRFSGKAINQFKFTALTSYLPTPVITSDSKFFATEGYDFQLTCHVEVHSGLPYTAMFSHNDRVAKTNDYMTVTELQHGSNDRQKAHLNLTIRQSIQERDEGDYKCTVMDYYNNTNSVIATMTFVSESVINLHPTNDFISIDKGKKQAQFLIEYTAFPSAAFFFYDPRNEQISSDMDVMNRQKYDVEIKSDQIRFKVKYPDLNDFGNYTLMARTAGRNSTTSLRLVVSGKLHCRLFKTMHNLNLFFHQTSQLLVWRTFTSWLARKFKCCAELSPTRKPKLLGRTSPVRTCHCGQTAERTKSKT